MTNHEVPGDIDTRSGNRLPPPRREDLDERTRPVFDRLADADGGSLAGLQGPAEFGCTARVLRLRCTKSISISAWRPASNQPSANSPSW